MASRRQTRTAVVLNDTSGHRHHGCALVMQSIRDLAAGHGLAVIGAAPVGVDWRARPDVVEAMERADVIIVNGEGSIHHDAPRGEALLHAGPFVRARGKAAVLINTTWEANSPRLAELAALFDIVSVRESASARELAGAGVACRVVPDLALGSARAAVERPRSGVAFSDNVVTARTLAQYAAMRRLGGRPLCLSHGSRGLRAAAGSLRRYLRAGGTVGAAMRAVAHDLASQVDDRSQFLERLGSQGLVVTGRFHMVILCLATETPFLAIPSNTHKIESMLDDVGLGHWRMPDLESLNEDLMARAAIWQPGELAAVSAYLSGAERGREELFRDIRRLADGQERRASSTGTGGA